MSILHNLIIGTTILGVALSNNILAEEDSNSEIIPKEQDIIVPAPKIANKMMPGKTAKNIIPGKTAKRIVPGKTIRHVVPGKTVRNITPGHVRKMQKKEAHKARKKAKRAVHKMKKYIKRKNQEATKETHQIADTENNPIN